MVLEDFEQRESCDMISKRSPLVFLVRDFGGQVSIRVIRRVYVFSPSSFYINSPNKYFRCQLTFLLLYVTNQASEYENTVLLQLTKSHRARVLCAD